MKISNRSISRKIILAFLLACAAVLLSISISNISFRKILQRVDQLAEPNTRLQLVNHLFREIVLMDQLQHNEAFKHNQHDYTGMLAESEVVQQLLDSLKGISRGDTLSVTRIDSMKRILYRRDRLLLDYLKLNRNLGKIDTLQEQIRSLTSLIEKAGDSSRVSTENRIVTTIEHIADTAAPQERQSLWARIFNKRKTNEVQQAKRLVRQYYDVTMDTLGVLQNDSSFYRLSAAIEGAEKDRLTKRSILLKQQQQLSQAGNILIARTLSILHDLEKQEVEQSAQSRLAARDIVNKSILNINLLLIVFIVVTGILVYVTLTDVARSNTYRQQLIAARDEAEHLGSVKQRFLANMSHELRTPLQIIIGMTEQMQEPGNRTTDKMNIISHASRHLLQVVNEVLDYSRIVSGKFLFEQQPFRLGEVLDEIAAVMQTQAGQKGLNFEVQQEADAGLMLSGDAFRLKQVLYNLLGNAVKFTDKGTITFAVSQKRIPRGILLTFVISDTGPGIPEASLPGIFNRFEQSGELAGEEQKGSGLGLNIARLLVEAFTGTISVRSSPGEGSSFEVAIPFTELRELPELIKDGKGIYTGIKGKVWIVDDDPFILQLCRDILDKYRVPNTCFGSAADLLKTKPDPELQLVLMDIRMPEMNGMELCRLLKQQLPDTVRMVALTAQAMPDELETIRNAGFDRVLTKPFLEQDFMDMVAGNMAAVASPEQAIPEEGYNLDRLRQMVGEQVLPDIIANLKTATLKDLELLTVAMEKNDHAACADLLHKLAGRIGQVGAGVLAADCRLLEQRLRNGDMAMQDLEPLQTRILHFVVQLAV